MDAGTATLDPAAELLPPSSGAALARAISAQPGPIESLHEQSRADLAALIRQAVAHEVAPLIQQVLEVEVSRRKVCSLTEACARYGKTREWLSSLVTDPDQRIRHRWIPGRGVGGKELSINLTDLAKAMGEL